MNKLSAFLTASLVLRLATATAFAQMREVPLTPIPVGGALGAAVAGTNPTNLQLPASALERNLAIAPSVELTATGSPSPLAGAAVEPLKTAPLAGSSPLAQSGPSALSARPEATGLAGSKTAAAGPKAIARPTLGGRAAEPGEPGGKSRIPTLDLAGEGRTLFDGGREHKPAAATASDPVASHEKGFERYVRSLMGAKTADARQTRALLEMYLEERGVEATSELALELERRLLPAKPQVSPRFKTFAPVLIKVSEEYGVPVARLEAMMKEQDLLSVLAGARDSELLENFLTGMIEKDRVNAIVDRYPDNAQGRALKHFAGNLTAPSGKSIEEITRAGAFLYVNFLGRTVRESDIASGRDPDVGSYDVVFYGVRSGKAFKFGVYRQNHRRGVSDAVYTEALKAWFIAGGIPESDLAF